MLLFNLLALFCLHLLECLRGSAMGGHVEATGQLSGISSLSLLCEFQGLDCVGGNCRYLPFNPLISLLVFSESLHVQN